MDDQTTQTRPGDGGLNGTVTRRPHRGTHLQMLNFMLATLGRIGERSKTYNEMRSRYRTERMQDMVRLLRLPERARIIDLGGNEYNWKLIDHNFHVTIVNLPGSNSLTSSDPSRYEITEGDACDLRERYADNSFDVAFSNSVIEHVGDESRQAEFAREARRLAPAYWVQTPSPKFPIEAHTSIPLYWKLPASTREGMLSHWEDKFPVWIAMLRETRVLSGDRLRELFPDGQIYREMRFGLEKSNSIYRPYPAAG